MQKPAILNLTSRWPAPEDRSCYFLCMSYGNTVTHVCFKIVLDAKEKYGGSDSKIFEKGASKIWTVGSHAFIGLSYGI